MQTHFKAWIKIKIKNFPNPKVNLPGKSQKLTWDQVGGHVGSTFQDYEEAVVKSKVNWKK